ncbi:ferritin-like domain-containing protein [Thermosediminibacter oceani]|uniref:ferritin-like domain-containing protein n=1 Tax=Thermosediminibacter oceani TaxID=291990 RepID=UPI0002E211D3|nr:ferritin-like domain-containing protein [Thermosediminibacter oceani]
MQLTQKEKLYLQDTLSHERVSVTKCNYYASQAQDPQVANMLRNLANREQQHIDTITNLLQQAGVQPPAH